MKRVWFFSLLIFVLVLLDQFSKGIIQASFYLGESVTVINDFFYITYVRNPGAAFGIGAGAADWIRKPLFFYLPVLACFWLVWLIWTSRQATWRLGLGYTLVLAGALGNLIDRFSLNYVVDFLDFRFWGRPFPAFNVADSCITVAAFLLIIDYFLEMRSSKLKANASDSV